ncbi:peroxidase-related enzyme [Halomarina oriensis]|uniref:Peroxidase-related enzyme n=1 Tax=Halomarina oriensis TaxID=671145 RepID=A0A6B0GVJ8_9EURY|nr:peroxidase-related enzyme [Halomarina oriensis]MWG36155.1 peroxidase-related enzyme [Halomarina oriensis]
MDDQSDPAMGNFPVPDHADLPEDLQERIEEETERAGFTPNVFSAMAYKPSHFRAFFEYHDALVEDTALEREEIEMLVVTISGVNDCLYCVVAHGALVRIYAKDPQLADQLATNHRAASLNPTHRAMLDFAVTLTESPGRIDETDLETLRQHGFSDEAIWDITSVVAYYNLSNRLAVVADMRPNEEFYTLGREPRE